MCCLVVRVYCSLSHHLSQPSPLFLRSLTWDCFICCCFLQLTDDDAMSVTLWLTCLVRVRQHVQLYSAAGIFEITPPLPSLPVPFYLTEGFSTCIMLLHGHPILSNRSRKWKDYGLIGGRWLLFRTRPLLAWIFQYNRNIDNNWVGIF